MGIVGVYILVKGPGLEGVTSTGRVPDLPQVSEVPMYIVDGRRDWRFMGMVRKLEVSGLQIRFWKFQIPSVERVTWDVLRST